MVQEKTLSDSWDVIVIGGGLAGLTATCFLGSKNIRVLCLDRAPLQTQVEPDFDGRTTAISYGSQKLLKAAGVWPLCHDAGAPIEKIEILDGDSPVLLEFDKDEVNGRLFGWIFENQRLRQCLAQRLEVLETAAYRAPSHVTGFTEHKDYISVHLKDGSHFKSRLVIGADGRRSFTREAMGITSREWLYGQQAVVCTVIHDNPHHNIAVEHFRTEGPFAILPLQDDKDGHHRSSVVWTEHRKTGRSSRSALDFDQQSFDAALTARFPSRYGQVRQIGKRFAFPLGLVHAHSYIAPRVALVADAAHGIHPIAGQGLNMGFRDIAELVPLVAEALNSGGDPGASSLLQTYQKRRRPDNVAMAGATDSLNKLFSNDILPVRLARKAGLRMVSRLPPAKRFFMKQAMGASGLLPALIKDSEAA